MMMKKFSSFKKSLLFFIIAIILINQAKAHVFQDFVNWRIAHADSEYMDVEFLIKPPIENDSDTKYPFYIMQGFGVLLGIPPYVSIENEVLQREYFLITSRGIKQNSDSSSTTIDNIDLNTIKIADIFWLRSQRVLKLIVKPLQRDLENNVQRFYTKILIRINFNYAGESRDSTKGDLLDHEIFEDILEKTLINYDAAKRWRSKSIPTLSEAAEHYDEISSSTSLKQYKIITKEEGVYLLTYEDFKSVKINLEKIDPRRIRITNCGEEIPILIQGEDDGYFDKNDYIEFYATPPPNGHIKYTDHNVYILSMEPSFGKRMTIKDGSEENDPLDIPFSFKVTYHGEQDKEHLNPSTFQDTDSWYWAKITAEPDYPGKRYFIIPALLNMDYDREFCLRFSLRGMTDAPNTDDDHHTRVYLNDHLINDSIWKAQEELSYEGAFPSTYLVEGDNVLKVELPGDLDVFADQVFINWFEIEYYTSTAKNGSLKFKFQPESGAGHYEFRCRGFYKNDVVIYDISDKREPQRIIQPRIMKEAEVEVIFQDYLDDSDTEREYLVIESDQRKTPVEITKDPPSDLKSVNNQADYIIMVFDEFYDDILPLATYRTKNGLRVKIVKISDIYDEFSGGIFTPEAIKDFLSYAYYFWRRPAPSFVLLVGDANWDYKDNMGYGVENYVPTFITKGHDFKDAASDNWLVCVSGIDSVPDMMVGRIPVRSNVELKNVVEKIFKYERIAAPVEWQKNFILVSDDEIDGAGQESIVRDFISDEWNLKHHDLNSTNLSPDMALNEKIEATIENFTPLVIADINEGAAIVQYSGHGGLRVWSKKHILDSRISSDNFEQIKNNGKLPVVFAYSCLNGYFDSPMFQTIAERFLNFRDCGSIAYLSSTRDSNALENYFLNLGMLESLFMKHEKILGKAFYLSKINTIIQVVNYMPIIEEFTYFGDPALRIFFNKKDQSN